MSLEGKYGQNNEAKYVLNKQCKMRSDKMDTLVYA